MDTVYSTRYGREKDSEKERGLYSTCEQTGTGPNIGPHLYSFYFSILLLIKISLQICYSNSFLKFDSIVSFTYCAIFNFLNFLFLCTIFVPGKGGGGRGVKMQLASVGDSYNCVLGLPFLTSQDCVFLVV